MLLDTRQTSSTLPIFWSGSRVSLPICLTRYGSVLKIFTAYERPLPPIMHYSAVEPFTKYEMCLVFAKILGISHGHVVPDADEPKGESAVSRPKNTQLSVLETEKLGVELGCGGF